MTRNVHRWRDQREAARNNPDPAIGEIAPHRYTYHANTDFRWDGRNYTEWKKAVPYQPGEIVYFYRDGEEKRALIVDIFYDRQNRERTGDLREKYRVRYETKKGNWSNNWLDVHPGDVQRGYQAAGLADADLNRWHPLPVYPNRNETPTHTQLPGR